MKPQTIFNKVVRHLAEQGRPALTDEDQCVYRSVDGLKCAVGALISDAKYSEDMEGRGLRPLLTDFPKLPGYMHRNADLLNRLQSVHDNATTTRAGKFHKRDISRRLAAAADDYGLDPSVIVECFPGHRFGAA